MIKFLGFSRKLGKVVLVDHRIGPVIRSSMALEEGCPATGMNGKFGTAAHLMGSTR